MSCARDFISRKPETRNPVSITCDWINILLALSKFKISFLSSLSSATGFILAGDGFSVNIIIPFLGVFLLACGASALNQYQERDTDRLMERTKHRPVASYKLSANSGLFISLSLLLSGFIILSFALKALLLAIFICIWYNFVYTPLKRKISFSAIPGALIGSLTPAIGWLAGGGNFFDRRILVLIFFFFIWQIPHSWLNLLSHGQDYEKTGFPSITKVFTEEQLARIIFVWLLATAMTGLLIPLFIVNSLLVNFCLFLSTVWLIWKSTMIIPGNEKRFSFLFSKINIYAFLVISLLSLDKLLIIRLF